MSAVNGPMEERPPWEPVIAVGAVALAAVALASMGFSQPALPLLIAGYVLGAIVAVGLMTLYRALKAKRRSKAFRPSPLRDLLAMAFTIVGVVAGLTCAFLLATEIAKRV